MLELQSDSDDQYGSRRWRICDEALRSRYFWLCGECAKTHMIKRWTTSGLVLMLRNQNVAGNGSNLIKPAVAATMQPLQVSPIVPPIPPMGHPPPTARFACAAEKFSWPKDRLTSKTLSDFPRHAPKLA